MKNQVADEEKLGGKLDDEEKETINDGIESTIEWLDENGEVSIMSHNPRTRVKNRILVAVNYFHNLPDPPAVNYENNLPDEYTYFQHLVRGL